MSVSELLPHLPGAIAETSVPKAIAGKGGGCVRRRLPGVVEGQRSDSDCDPDANRRRRWNPAAAAAIAPNTTGSLRQRRQVGGLVKHGSATVYRPLAIFRPRISFPQVNPQADPHGVLDS